MANTKITGNGTVIDSNFHSVKFTGKTKDGKAVVIELKNAICKSNIDFSLVEKDDAVASLEFEGCYTDADMVNEPWSITYDGASSGANGILLGIGKFSIDSTDVALCRGGGQFTVEREYRDINADGDMGSVMGRIVCEGSRPKLTINALTFLTTMKDVFPGVIVTTSTT